MNESYIPPAWPELVKQNVTIGKGMNYKLSTLQEKKNVVLRTKTNQDIEHGFSKI